MIKFRTLKNSYIKLEEKYIRILKEEEYFTKALDEAIEKLNSGKAVFYTHEEFWKLIREEENEKYNEKVSYNI